ncbi:MAG: hypothetical protein J6S14_15480 [Clostridia bacterium]|nr:hypothetical protein [Clostridia bacterium]
MTREKAHEIAVAFFSQMNPEFWNGVGEKPPTLDERVWECPLSEYARLDISLYYDVIDNLWCHCCEIVEEQSNDMIEMATGYGIDSIENLIDTICFICGIVSICNETI